LSAVLAVFALLATPAFAGSTSEPAFDWGPWRHLPTQAGGRYKPLDTTAREALLKFCSPAGYVDRQTDRKLDPVAMYLAMIFDWQGWGQRPDPHGTGEAGSSMSYFDAHEPDKWDHARLIRIDSPQLRKALRLAENRKLFSPLELVQATVRDPENDKAMPFGTWIQEIVHDRGKQSAIRESALELANKLQWYQHHRMGLGLEVIPTPGSKHQEWTSLAALMQSEFDDRTDPDGELRELQKHLRKARTAYREDSPEEFNRASTALIAAAKQFGPRLGEYPQQSKIDLEVEYNHWIPLSFAWVFALLSFFCALLSLVWQGRALYVSALACAVGSLLAILIGLGFRAVITGWIPVTNMYESVIFMALGTIVFGLIFELRSGRRLVLSAAAAVAASALILADYCPDIMDPSLRPLPPVLRSNFWLAIHVMSIMLSYAAFALALGIGNITLGFYLAGPNRRGVIRALSKFTYRLLRAGVLLLTIGTILGGVWADYAWGRFWGWDPKEVWALITLLFYLAVLHARYIGWVGNRGIAAWSVVCFSVLVVMAWYGVNYILNVGLHSYGFGGGGQIYVFCAVGLQLLYVVVAVTVSVLSAPNRGDVRTR